MNAQEATVLLQTALARFESARLSAGAPLASRDYARYAQAAYNLRHAQRVMSRALQKKGMEAGKSDTVPSA